MICSWDWIPTLIAASPGCISHSEATTRVARQRLSHLSVGQCKSQDSTQHGPFVLLMNERDGPRFSTPQRMTPDAIEFPGVDKPRDQQKFTLTITVRTDSHFWRRYEHNNLWRLIRVYSSTLLTISTFLIIDG